MKTLLAIVLCFAPAGLCAEKPSWDAKAAAAYLDQRAAWWAAWKPAARDHGTFCISCHTTLPYALGRPALRSALHETAPSTGEQQVIDNVRKRVRLWAEVEPFYSDAKNGVPKSAESRGLEAIVDALILTNADARTGEFTAESRQALEHMIALQYQTGEKAGAWIWLNFHNEPWEADDSQYWGVTLAAVAIGNAPASYRATPPVRDAVKLMSGYLQREQARQSLLNRLGLLWAAAKTPDLLTAEQKETIVRDLLAKQQEDGGWNTSSLLPATWKRKDNTSLDTASDGYATAIAAFLLEQSGMPQSSAGVNRAIEWLAQHQDHATGQWPATSPNKQRDPATDAGKLMSDAATAYAALALEGK
jgi:squalene-hopene/tetraprenyl-beta-curcumene cyclase